MFGGPWLGVLAFLIVAIALGWFLVSLFQQQLDHASQSVNQLPLDHQFNSQATYLTQKDLVLGYLADGRVVLLPGRNDLPHGTPGRRAAVSIEEFRNSPQDHRDIIGIVDKGTRLQFVEVIQDPDNPQTKLLIMTRLLTGPYAQKSAVLGMHLETGQTREGAGTTCYVPRADLFAIIEPSQGQVQSAVQEQAVK